tara:strand:- start:60 stop:1829 length:1770 start_codon:yes stop_codon:yes gene_type:complete
MRQFVTLLSLIIIGFGLQAQNLPIFKIYTYQSGQFDNGGAEVHAFEPLSKRLFSTNSGSSQVDIIRLGDLSKPAKIGSIDLSNYGGTVNSLAVQGNTLAVAIQNNFAQSDGKVVFFDTNGTYLNQLVVGPMPDMITFSPSLQHILVANEGEPSDDYTIDPAGSVSIIDISGGTVSSLSQANVQTVGFTRYDTTAYDPLINIYGNNGLSSFSQDAEPEYICINPGGTKAYVSLQENNALAIIDIYTATLDTVVGLGYKSWNDPSYKLDASDQSSGIKFENYFNLFGMYQPDAITYYGNYILSANEGDSRDYSGYSEEERINNVNLSPFTFNNPSYLQRDSVLGRLKVTTTLGNYNNVFIHDSLFTFGARSFSVWDTLGNLVWDSGDEFEQTLAALHAQNFNSDNDDNSSFKSRSDDKGPEPEAICTGTYNGSHYAFIALERMGGIMIYNIDDPTQPTFDSYILDRDFSKAASDPDAGDLGPEYLSFVSENQSPSGYPLLIVSNEISGTVSVYQLGSDIGIKEISAETLQAYPNPGQSIIKLSQEVEYELYNTDGKFFGHFNNNNLDLSAYPKGYYILRTADGSGLRILKN